MDAGFVLRDAASGGLAQPQRGVIQKPRASPWVRNANPTGHALKGHDTPPVRPVITPLQGYSVALPPSPRAMPWAFESRPFGAEEICRTPCCLEQNWNPNRSSQEPTFHLPTPRVAESCWGDRLAFAGFQSLTSSILTFSLL